MGVRTLWSLLDSCAEQVSSSDLREKVLAVDLAGWAVQAQTRGALRAGQVARPHLRNLFFRATAMINAGSHPVFVLDGAAPELKRETLNARRAASQSASQSQASSRSASQSQTTEVKSMSRSRLRAVLRECQFLLNAMGVTCVQASGEAEALCGQLNRLGLVDAVVSEDSDALCHGATELWRGFSVTGTGVAAMRYTEDRLKTVLGLSRDRCVLCAVLLGCDFVPAGVPGVGKEAVLQLLTGWSRDWDGVRVLESWIGDDFTPREPKSDCGECNNGQHCRQCRNFVSFVADDSDSCRCRILTENAALAKAEKGIKKKCLSMGLDWWRSDFPKVLAEFRREEPVPRREIQECKSLSRPNVPSCVSILTKKLLWTEEYAQQKVIPLLTRWQCLAGRSDELARPIRVVKKRTCAGIPSLQVEWEVVDGEVASVLPPTFESVVPWGDFEKSYPEILSDFLESQPKPKRAASKKKADKNKENEGSTQKQITSFFPNKKNNNASSKKVSSGKKNGELSSQKVSDFKRDEKLSENVSGSGQTVTKSSPLKSTNKVREKGLEPVREADELSDDGLSSSSDELSSDEDDAGELSFLIDQIVGKPSAVNENSKKPDSLKRTVKEAFVTSTPDGQFAKAKSRLPLLAGSLRTSTKGTSSHSELTKQTGMYSSEHLKCAALKGTKETKFKFRAATKTSDKGSSPQSGAVAETSTEGTGAQFGAADDYIPDDFEDSFDRMCL